MDARADMAEAGSATLPVTVRVWDPFIRIFHWSLVALFAFAFVTGDEWDKPHEIAGYTIAGLIALRVIWGFVGTKHARFTDFVAGPGKVAGYLKDAILATIPRAGRWFLPSSPRSRRSAQPAT